MREGIKPFVACEVGIDKTKSMSVILVNVKFDRNTGFILGINHSKLPSKKKIVGSYFYKPSTGIF
jgi:hypothetical protein